MPLIVVDKTVLYRPPRRDELPVIGSLYCNNELRIHSLREKHCREMPVFMSLLQKSLLKGKKNV
jgi:hypothetical protein